MNIRSGNARHSAEPSVGNPPILQICARRGLGRAVPLGYWAAAVQSFAVAVVTPSAEVLTWATELLPLLALFTAVWSLVSADCDDGPA